jgi:hypothetical protein
MKPIIIIIQPILFQLTGDLTSSLVRHISTKFDALVKIASPINDTQLPLINLFDKNRSQWKSKETLQWLLDRSKADRSSKY